MTNRQMRVLLVKLIALYLGSIAVATIGIAAQLARRGSGTRRVSVEPEVPVPEVLLQRLV